MNRCFPMTVRSLYTVRIRGKRGAWEMNKKERKKANDIMSKKTCEIVLCFTFCSNNDNSILYHEGPVVRRPIRA